MAATQYEYEKTLMYGRYSELQQFAQEFASVHRRQEQQRRPMDVNEARRKNKRLWRGWRWFSAKVLPYILDWLFILILGILMAVLSFIIDYCSEKIGEAHVTLSLKLLRNQHALVQYLFWVGYPVLFVLFSVGFVQVMSIHAIGSGIPEMKTVLRGISLTDYLTFRTFISKSIALITAVGSSLPIGKEGPFVHLSSIIAHIMSKLITTVNRVYANEAHNSELLAAACAIGVSCNFAAPIGGVLFSIEVTATYFAVRNYWRGFFGAVCGAFLFRLTSVFFSEEETITAIFKTNFSPDFPFELQELLAFSFIGIVAGLGGAFFVWFHRNYVLLRRKIRNRLWILEKHIFIYPTIITLVFTTLTFPLGFGQYMAGELTQRGAIDQLFSNLTWSNLSSEIDELPITTEEYKIIDQWGTPNIYVSLLIFIVVRFVFAAISVSLPIPSGVFFPVFVIGGAFGRLIGEAMAVWFPSGFRNIENLISGGYAVVGAAAMAGAVTHTISTSVIVFEVTGQITHILPVMIAVLIANAVANMLQPSFYDSIIMLKQLSYLPDLKPNKVYNLFATDIMRRDLVYLSYSSTYCDLKLMLHTTRHTSYPLVDAPDSRILIGSVSRLTLQEMLDEHMKGVHKHAQMIKEQAQQRAAETPDAPPSHTILHLPAPRPSSPSSSEQRTPSPVGGSGAVVLRRFSSAMPHSLARMFGASDETDLAELPAEEEGGESSAALEELRDQLLSQTIGFKPSHIDPAPFQLVERTSLYKIHSLFSILALSHAYVTSIGRFVGVVTLADLTDAIEGRRQPLVIIQNPLDDIQTTATTDSEQEEDEQNTTEHRLQRSSTL